MSKGVVAVEMVSYSRFMKYAVLRIHGNRFGETDESSDDFAVVGFKEFGIRLHAKQDPVAMIFTEVWMAHVVAITDVSPNCGLFTPAGAHPMGDEASVIRHDVTSKLIVPLA